MFAHIIKLQNRRDLNKLQEGIGEKLGMLTFFTGTFILSIIVAFVYGWDLTLVRTNNYIGLHSVHHFICRSFSP